MQIRMATIEDTQELLAIYTPYVEKTAITFEYEVPTYEEFKNRVAHTLEKYPYVVAVENSEIIGYAYTGQFKGRAAYDWAVETSIYVKEGMHKKGIGKALYAKIEEVSKKQNIQNLYACIGMPASEDTHLTANSMEFHAHLGFELIGTFHKCGYKFDTWYDMIWMEKMLGEHNAQTPKFIPCPQLHLEFE